MWPWWVKIPTVDVTDETLAIDDTHGDDVRGGDWGAGHGGWQGGWHGIEDVTVSIGDTYGDDVKGNGVGGGHKWHHLVVKFRTDKSGATWSTNFQLMEVVPSGG